MSATTPSSAPPAEDVAALQALANETRYAALRFLARADGEVCACRLTEPLDVSQSTVSHALSRLHEAGLLDRRKDGRWRYYRPTERAERLLAVLAETRSPEGEA